MTARDTAVPWFGNHRTEWITEVARWITTRLGVDIAGNALEPVKQRPWGAVLRAETTSGPVIFKAVGRRGRHETILLADLAALHSGLVPEVIAVDHERGWLLMPDHGEMIARESTERQVSIIEQLLPHYASLQRATSGSASRWIAAGVPQRGPRQLPGLLEGLLGGEGRSGPLPIDEDEVRRSNEIVESFTFVCESLATGPIPLAVDHADIHGTNVLLGGAGPRLIDWGDACIGHPFSSLLVPVEWVAGRLDRHEQPDAVARLVDAYLDPWGKAGDRAALGRAIWVGYIARAVSNDEQSIDGSPADIADAHAEIVALLRAWRQKHACLDSVEDMLVPAMPL